MMIFTCASGVLKAVCKAGKPTKLIGRCHGGWNPPWESATKNGCLCGTRQLWDPYNWSYKWISGVTPKSGVILLLITGKCLPCTCTGFFGQAGLGDGDLTPHPHLLPGFGQLTL